MPTTTLFNLVFKVQQNNSLKEGSMSAILHLAIIRVVVGKTQSILRFKNVG